MRGVAEYATPTLTAVAAIATALSAASLRWLPSSDLTPVSELAAGFEPEAWLSTLWTWLLVFADWMTDAGLADGGLSGSRLVESGLAALTGA